MTKEAANGRGAADPAILRTTVERVVERFAPEQVILFGSAARREMTPESDIDLLVIRKRLNRECEIERERWRADAEADAEPAYDADLVLMDRATAEAGRASITRIEGIALEEGETLYAGPGTDPLPTGPEYWRDGNRMVKKTQFDPEEAERLVAYARDYWKMADDPQRLPATRCIQLQTCMEYGLKALIIAQGRRVPHKHDLDALWTEAEKTGERIAAVRNPAALARLSRYSGDLRYDSPGRGHDPGAIWQETRTTALDLLNHAETRVPALIKETAERLESHEAADRRAGAESPGTDRAIAEGAHGEPAGTEGGPTS